MFPLLQPYCLVPYVISFAYLNRKSQLHFPFRVKVPYFKLRWYNRLSRHIIRGVPSYFYEISTPLDRSLSAEVFQLMKVFTCWNYDIRSQNNNWPATSWVHYTTSCNTQSSAPEDGQNNCPKHVELTGIINKTLLLYLVGCLYYLYFIIFFWDMLHNLNLFLCRMSCIS